MLVVYDNNGTIYFAGTGKETPVGIPYLDIPREDGKVLKRVDISTEPHTPIWEDYPKSELELLRERVAELEATQAIMLTGESEVTG